MLLEDAGLTFFLHNRPFSATILTRRDGAEIKPGIMLTGSDSDFEYFLLVTWQQLCKLTFAKPFQRSQKIIDPQFGGIT